MGVDKGPSGADRGKGGDREEGGAVICCDIKGRGTGVKDTEEKDHWTNDQCAGFAVCVHVWGRCHDNRCHSVETLHEVVISRCLSVAPKYPRVNLSPVY